MITKINKNGETKLRFAVFLYKKYFTIKIDRHPYAKETVMKFKRTLATILADAKRQRLVEHNFASRDYIAPIQGYKKEEINLKRKPEEGIEYHGHIEKRTLYGNRSFYVAVPDASEKLNMTSFKIENKPLDINEGDNVIFTVFSEPNYAKKGELFWKVRNISIDE